MIFDIGFHYTGNPIVRFSGANPETLAEAFDISIAKWEFIVQQMRENGLVILDGGTNTCGLCMMFREWSDELGDETCGDCPVVLHTGMDGCNETPYEDFYPHKKTVEQKIAAAEAELVFLKMLRERHCVVQS